MNGNPESGVLIVGAGPVGLSLAMDLAARGIQVVVAEMRRYAEPPSVKCNHVSARTMEQFRRLGVAHKLRDTGLPADYPNDIAFRTSLTGTELGRIPIPCRRERYTSAEGPDTWWPTPEPPHRINQIYMEPVLLEHTAALPGVTLLNRTQVTGFRQDANGVIATAIDLDTGATRTIACRYLVGCDGGGSEVRKQMGARLAGTAVVQRVQSTCIRAPRLQGLIPGKPAWGNYSINPRRCGTVFAIDGRDTWLVHNHLNADEPQFDSVDRDQSIRDILGVGADFEYTVQSEEDWVGRRLVADSFRNGRVFIAGDAAHLWLPYAGYGMNAGIADALNLSWLLAARLQGWGEEAMLDAYQAERQPITEQVSHFAMNHAQQMIKARGAVPAGIEAPGPAGDALRAEVGAAAYALNVQQFCCGGLNFGYFYAGSPIIAHEAEAAPAYTMQDFTPSTVPAAACRICGCATDACSTTPLVPAIPCCASMLAPTQPAWSAVAQARRVPLAPWSTWMRRKFHLPHTSTSWMLCRADQHVVCGAGTRDTAAVRMRWWTGCAARAPERRRASRAALGAPAKSGFSTSSAMPWPPPMQADRDAVAQMAALEFARQRDGQAHAGGGQRVADGDGAAVDIELVAVELELVLHRHALRATSTAGGCSLNFEPPMSSIFRPARSSSRRIAGAGPMPKISGATPTTAAPSTFASGVKPWSRAYAPEPTSAAAAPSTTAELLPPVCTPPKAAGIFASTSTGEVRTWLSAANSLTLEDRRMPRAR